MAYSFYNKKDDTPGTPGMSKAYHRILITGVGKTGSTALFHAILSTLPEGTVNLFEPESGKKTLPEDIHPPVLVKSFIPYSENFNFFEKKILIIRDPRDQMISALLYKPYNILTKDFPGELDKAMELIHHFQDLIRQKETSPMDVPVRLLIKTLKIGVQRRQDRILDYLHNNPDVFILKYEDFIDNHLRELSDYLGLDIQGAVNVPAKYERVIRSKGYGNWRSWYTPSDVEFFRPVMQEFLNKFGYGDEWELEKEPRIDPEISSLYIEKIIREGLERRAHKKI